MPGPVFFQRGLKTFDITQGNCTKSRNDDSRQVINILVFIRVAERTMKIKAIR